MSELLTKSGNHRVRKVDDFEFCIEKDIRPKIKDVVNELFRSIPLGLGSQGAVKLTKSELDELLVEGVDWAIEQGYGWKQDAQVCEEGGRMVGADPTSVSDMARKRG